MKTSALFVLIFSLNSLFSQLNIPFDSLSSSLPLNDSLKSSKPLPPGNFVEYIDSFYFATEALQKKINLSKCPDLVNGYRVQLFSCSGEGCTEKANKYYSQFLIAFPLISVYKMWQAPTIKVRAGDCRDRFEAQKIKAEIKDHFPFVFIVPDHIESNYKIDCSDMKFTRTDALLIRPLIKR
jgi:hypothetical protein